MGRSGFEKRERVSPFQKYIQDFPTVFGYEG